MPFTTPKNYVTQFQHQDWIDNVDRVQAAGENGFNRRFHGLEEEFERVKTVLDNLATIATELQTAVANLQGPGQIGDTLNLKNLTVQEKVGIGTLAPDTNLHVQKNQNATTRVLIENTDPGANAGTRFIARESPTKAVELGYINSGVGAFRDLNPNTAYVAALLDASALAFNHQGTGPITFHTDDWRERMRISHNGNVGIGTTDPKGKLSVMQTVAGLSTGLQISSHHTPGVVAGAIIDAFDDGGVTVRGLTLQSNGGNVGIGTTGPAATLDVNGTARIGNWYQQNLDSNGYARVGSLLIQWGQTGAIQGDENGQVTFPIAFTNVYQVVATDDSADNFDNWAKVRNVDVTGFVARREWPGPPAAKGSGTVRWIAIGQ